MAKPTLTYTKTGVELTRFNSSANIIKSETINTDANLFRYHIPLTNPDNDIGSGSIGSQENISITSKQTNIALTGVYLGTPAEILLFVQEIEAEANSGNQQPKKYINSIGRPYGVKINNFTYVTAPNTTQIGYTLEFFKESLPPS